MEQQARRVAQVSPSFRRTVYKEALRALTQYQTDGTVPDDGKEICEGARRDLLARLSRELSQSS